MSSVELTRYDATTWTWPCGCCGVTNILSTSHLGFVICTNCGTRSFITKVNR